MEYYAREYYLAFFEKNLADAKPADAKPADAKADGAFDLGEALLQLNMAELQQLYAAWVLISDKTSGFDNLIDFMPSYNEVKLSDLKYVNLLDDALKQGNSIFVEFLMNTVVNISILWMVYLRRNHYDTRGIEPSNDWLELLLVGKAIHSPRHLKTLIHIAINGDRQDPTYRMNDFYNYIEPNLNMVKKIVPAYISTKAGLQIWEDYDACTYSYGFNEQRHPFEKNEAIYNYLK
jgi:hypothetical protein